MHFLCFYPFFELTAWQPYRLSHINALHINFFYSPKDQVIKFWQQNIENWRSWKITLFWVSHFDFFFQFFFFFASSQWKDQRLFIWGIIYFCTINGFFRILEKTSSELICTRLYVLRWKTFSYKNQSYYTIGSNHIYLYEVAFRYNFCNYIQ